MRKKTFIGTMALLVFISAKTVQSQWNPDPYLNNAICTAPGFQYASKITSDEKGGAYIVWEDFRDGSSKIYAQRIDKNGNIKWNLNGLQICNINSGQSNPQVINDGAGGVLIIWVDDRNSNYDLYAQRVDSIGNKLWNADGIIVFENDGNQTQPQVSRNTDNIFYVTCLDDRMGTQNIFVQKLDLQGNLIWGDNGIIGNHFRSLRNFKSILDKENNLILVWEDFSFNQDGMVFAQKLDQNGNYLWEFNQDDLRISSSDLNIKAQSPDVIQLQNGNYMIVWQDDRSGDFDIYGQIILPNGANLLTSEGEYLEGAAGNDVMPELCLSGNDYYMIAWINNNSPDSFLKVRSFYSNPVTFIQYWSQTLDILQEIDGWFDNINLTADLAGGVLLSFVAHDAEYSDIGFAKISLYGNKKVGTICNADINQSQLSVCSDSSDGIIATWSDLRSGDFDIYCSQVDANGVFGSGPHETGLIADYRFDGDASDAAYGNNATVFNASLTTDRFGNLNSAFDFNGLNAFIAAPSTIIIESPKRELTQTAWVYLYDWGINSNSFVPIIMKSDSPDNAFQYRLALSPNTVITSVNNWLNTVWQTGFNMNLNEWYMITSVLKVDTVTTYVNSEYIGFALLNGLIDSDNKPLVIGRDVPGTTEYFYGKLDDIKIYNRALTYKEVINLYNFGNTTDIKETIQSVLPAKFILEQNYPNPFNPSTSFHYQLPVSANVEIKVFDVLGREVETLLSEYKNAGNYEIMFNADRISSGVYFYSINVRGENASFYQINKMLLIK